ncbi:MAG: cellulase family glycosylhydrolase [Bacteroidales bacterium]|nr:cellulase family glycosylhydrolase [Bacteroidales bacterium]MCF8391259.1 cellulase family glycosylhydrolase [Bacteroidales bacterium]
MNLKYTLLFSAAASFLIGHNVNAQLTPMEANTLMGRGINLGNTLETPNTEGSWGNGPAKEYYFDDYKAAGFTNVRIPVKWGDHVSMTSPYAIDPTWFNRVEQIVDWGLARGLIITINAHHDNWIKENYGDPLMRARFDSIWSQVATRFRDKSEYLFFEIINEPLGLTVDNINDLNARVLSIIRKTNPTRIVIYSGHEWSSAERLMEANIPNDDYVMGYYHSYDPWNFAGEAIGTWGTDAEYAALEARFAKVDSWSKANNIPVTISEFGTMGECDYNSKMRFYAAYTEKSLNHNISFSVWDDGGWFKMYLRSSRKWNDLKDVVIYTSNQSPTNLSLNVYNDSLVKLNWTNRFTDYDSISVERRTEYTSFAPVESLDPGVSNYIDKNVLTNTYYYYRLIVHLKDGSVIHSYPVRIYFVPTQTGAFNGVPATIPGIVQAENYDLGEEGIAYHDSDGENIPGDYRPDEAVDIEARPDSGYQLTGIVSGEWINYTVNVTQAGNYQINYYLATEKANGIFYLEFKNGKTSNIRVPLTGSWTELGVFSNNFFLEEGKQVVKLVVLGSYPFNLDRIEFISAPNSVENEIDNSLNVFPNPVSDKLQVSSNKGIISSVRIYNSFGQKMYNSFTEVESMILPTENYAPGIYFIEVEINSVKYNSRFIKN